MTTVRCPQVHDLYRFNGLPGPTEPDAREMRIVGISVSGELHFSIAFMGEPARGINAVPLSEALSLIELGVWELVTPDDYNG